MKSIFLFLVACMVVTGLMAAPRAVVFDFGGVLTREPDRNAVVMFLRESFHLSAAEFERVNQEKRQSVKQGKSDEGFWLAYAQERGVMLPANWVETFRSVMKQAIAVNPDMYFLVEELQREGVRVALLSNVDEGMARRIREFGFYAPFDPCLLSCDMGMIKPDPKIYEMLLEELQLSAEQVVFIDDRLENVEAARLLGIDAIGFESEAQLRAELHQRGLLM